ncbi:Dual specificity protein kinase lkh1 [Symbiodinium microadriaticum]|uniref:Dual specificity protein kinase lkh1 n=1 Tax=Symbiodinium microadriaticum TaxID=2951 RepID=A0A1Q9D7K9_SYMMI|nr:Dual specificity protein kinase lkh1 [Symbiodinium microadriaticum]
MASDLLSLCCCETLLLLLIGWRSVKIQALAALQPSGQLIDTELNSDQYFLVKLGILHTDLKCRNVMLNDERYCAAPHPRDPGTEALRPQDCSIRIVDFGSAIHQDETFRGRACTRQFRSPEVALGLQWDEKLDIWSAGCIIAMLYTGVRPFSVHENQEHLAMMERLMDDRFPKHMLRTARRNRTDQDEGQLVLAMPMPATSNQSTETPISSLDASNRTEEEEPVCEVPRSTV